jgi:hypothetical protein
MSWKDSLADIQEDQRNGGGPAALKSVKDAAGATGKNARGANGRGTRERTFADYIRVTQGQANERDWISVERQRFNIPGRL